MFLPDSSSADNKKLVRALADAVQRCNTSRSSRGAFARTIRQWRYAGSEDRTGSLYNRLNCNNDRLSSYLFAPGDLRFHLEFESPQINPMMFSMADIAGQYLTARVEAADLDLMFGEAVDMAVMNGAAFIKLMWSPNHGIQGRLVPMYNFGVWREDEPSLNAQEALCETTYITRFDLWRRLGDRPKDVREKLYKRAIAQAARRNNSSEAESYFHSVLIAQTGTPVQTTGMTTGLQTAGGIVDLTTTPVGLTQDPNIADDLIPLYELTIWDDSIDDYTTCQFVWPDIIIEPYLKKKNLFIKQQHPYVLVQSNPSPNYLWGRSELLDLLNLQAQLSERMMDMARLSGIQFDRLLAIIGGTGIGDEEYAASRLAGFIQMETGSDVKDITPQFPAQFFDEIKLITEAMDDVSGFGPILSGKGESGVRAGTHANTLLKTASPRLRKRSLRIERQCAEMGQKVFELLKAKEPEIHVGPKGEEFIMSQLPDDIRVTVDSHSSSPIYEDDHKELAMFLEKAGAIGPEDVLDLVPVPRRELLKEHLRAREAAQAAFMQQHPELALKGKHK